VRWAVSNGRPYRDLSIRLPTAANESLPSLATELIDEIWLEKKSWQHMQAAPPVK